VLTGKIVFASGNFGDYDIFLLDLDSNRLTQLTAGPYWNDQPRLSPDASQVVFTSNRSGKQEIWLMNHDGSEPRSLTPQLSSAHAPAWSPDGQSLAFVSNQYFQDDIFTLHLATGEIKRLTSHDGFDGYPDWSPDGKKIVYVSQRGENQDIYLINIETLAEERITSHPAPDTSPAFSPDGQRLAFVSERPDSVKQHRFLKSLWDYFYGDDDLDIWLIELGSGQLRQLTSQRGADRYVRWSPDGRFVVFTNSAAQDVATRLLLCEAATGIISPLEIDRDMLNLELRGSSEIKVLTKSDPLLDKITPAALDAIYEKVGQKALDRTYYATERYIDWR
jgi:Tol biopolymer transport system component